MFSLLARPVEPEAQVWIARDPGVGGLRSGPHGRYPIDKSVAECELSGLPRFDRFDDSTVVASQMLVEGPGVGGRLCRPGRRMRACGKGGIADDGNTSIDHPRNAG